MGYAVPSEHYPEHLFGSRCKVNNLSEGAARTFGGGEVALIRVDRHQQRGERAVLQHVRLDLVGPPSGRHRLPSVPPRAHAPENSTATRRAPGFCYLQHHLLPRAHSFPVFLLYVLCTGRQDGRLSWEATRVREACSRFASGLANGLELGARRATQSTGRRAARVAMGVKPQGSRQGEDMV